MLGNVVNEAIKLLPMYDDEQAKSLGWRYYLKEYQTIMIGVPRQTGKTTLIKLMESNLSALAFYSLSKQSVDMHSPDRFRGLRRHNGPKYTCILLDGYKAVPGRVLDIIAELKLADMVASNLFILGLYTP